MTSTNGPFLLTQKPLILKDRCSDLGCQTFRSHCTALLGFISDQVLPNPCAMALSSLPLLSLVPWSTIGLRISHLPSCPHTCSLATNALP